MTVFILLLFLNQNNTMRHRPTLHIGLLFKVQIQSRPKKSNKIKIKQKDQKQTDNKQKKKDASLLHTTSHLAACL